MVVWKGDNDPVVQFGWDHRSVENTSVKGLDVIHARYRPDPGSLPQAIVGASPFYDSNNPALKPDRTKTLAISLTDVVCETGCPPLYNVHALQNVRLRFENIRYVDGARVHALGESVVHELRGGVSAVVDIVGDEIGGL